MQMALIKNLKSPMSWHMKGSIHKIQKEFEQAIACFKKSVEYDPKNQQVLRDLVTLQTHLQNWGGALEACYKFRECQKNNITYFALLIVFTYLTGNVDQAVKLISDNREFLANKNKYQMSEVWLFQMYMLFQSERYQDVLDLHEKSIKHVTDMLSADEMLAESQLKLGMLEKAKANYTRLINTNSSNKAYYEGYLQCCGLDLNNDDIGEKLKEELAPFIEKNPRLLFLDRLLVTHSGNGEMFENELKTYMQKVLKKGAPSLVNDLKHMLRQDSKKMATIQAILESWQKSMSADMTIEGQEQDPLQECFILKWLAEVYDLQEQYAKAEEAINLAIEHTPTMTELWLVKGRILKNLGDLEGARDAVRESKELDEGDRFLNYKTAKYTMRLKLVEEANETMLRWSTYHDGDGLNSHEYQNTMYSYETAMAYLRQGQLIDAFKYFNIIERNVKVQYEDAYDFHIYTVRKFNFRTFCEMPAFKRSLYTDRVIKAGYRFFDTLREIDYSKDSDSMKEDIDNHMKEHKPEDKPDDDDIQDVLLKYSDPTHVLAVQDSIKEGVHKVAIDKVELFKQVIPDDKVINWEGVYWYSQAGNWKQALACIDILKAQHQDTPYYISAQAILAQRWNSADQSKVKVDVAGVVTKTGITETNLQQKLEASATDVESALVVAQTLRHLVK